MQTITPFLWFNDNAEEAVNFYVATFKNSKIISTSRYPEGGPMPAGTVMVVSFELDGTTFTALNGGPVFQFNEAISFVVACETQAEIDRLWDALTTNGGHEGQCGWCKDKFGVSWQITPATVGETIGGPDAEGRARAMAAMMPMKKLDMAALEAAYKGA